MTDAVMESNRSDSPASARRYLVLLLAMLGLLYALLQNGYWSVGTDSELYLSTARNLAAGRGFTFNGLATGLYPPGWPAFLAAVMSVSVRFWFLNAIAKLLLLAGAALYFRALLYVTTPARSFVCVALAATVWWWYRCGYVLYSESLFICLLAAALLLAFQMARGRARAWRIAALVILCGLLPGVRWLGVLAAGVAALAAVTGERRPTATRKWLAFVLMVAAAVIVFAILYVTTANGTFARWTGAVAEVGSSSDEFSEQETPGAARAARHVAGLLRKVPVLGQTEAAAYANRVLSGGVWMCHQLWPITELAASSRLVFWASNAVGWLLWLLVAIFMWARLKDKNWIWLGLALYAAALIVRWPHARGRYLIVFGPFWILAIWGGLDAAAAWLARRAPKFARFGSALPSAILLLIALFNAFVFAVDIWVQRSPNFYGRYEAGQYETLIDAAHYVREATPPETRVAIYSINDNLGRRARVRVGAAAFAMLTDHPVTMVVGAGETEQASPAALAAMARERNIPYYLCRLPSSPWRLWHFKVPWLQRWVTGIRSVPLNPTWELYHVMDDGSAVKIELPHVEGWPVGVPPVPARETETKAF